VGGHRKEGEGVPQESRSEQPGRTDTLIQCADLLARAESQEVNNLSMK